MDLLQWEDQGRLHRNPQNKRRPYKIQNTRKGSMALEGTASYWHFISYKQLCFIFIVQDAFVITHNGFRQGHDWNRWASILDAAFELLLCWGDKIYFPFQVAISFGPCNVPLICKTYLLDDNIRSLGILCRFMLLDFYLTLGRHLISFFFPGCMRTTVSSMKCMSTCWLVCMLSVIWIIVDLAFSLLRYKWNFFEVALDKRLDFFESNWAFFAGFGNIYLASYDFVFHPWVIFVLNDMFRFTQVGFICSQNIPERIVNHLASF